jgi:hypothetical protein
VTRVASSPRVRAQDILLIGGKVAEQEIDGRGARLGFRGGDDGSGARLGFGGKGQGAAAAFK